MLYFNSYNFEFFPVTILCVLNEYKRISQKNDKNNENVRIENIIIIDIQLKLKFNFKNVQNNLFTSLVTLIV